MQAELEWQEGLNESVASYLSMYQAERRTAKEEGFSFSLADERRWRSRFDKLRANPGLDVGEQIEIAARNAEELSARLAVLRLKRIARDAAGDRRARVI